MSGARAILLLVAAGCVKPGPADDRCIEHDGNELVATVEAPLDPRTALVFRTHGDATATGAHICVEDSDRRWLVAVGHASQNVRVRWLSSTNLEIEELSTGRSQRVVDVARGTIACEPARSDGRFCEADGTWRAR